MIHLSDIIPPAPVSPFPPEGRVIPIGGVLYLVNARHGGFLANQNDKYIGSALMRYGESGEIEYNLISQLIQPGMNVMDVGANIGVHTVPLAKIVGMAGRIIAVEPQRVIHQYLCSNISVNGLPNVEAHQCGAGEWAGDMAVPFIDYYMTQNNNFGGVALLKAGEQGEKVAIRTLDDIAGDRDIHFMKIDVEGMEEEALRGAKRLLKRCRPLLYVRNEHLKKSESLIRHIMHHGYRILWHLPALYNPANYFAKADNTFPSMRRINMLCIPKELELQQNSFLETRDVREHPMRMRA